MAKRGGVPGRRPGLTIQGIHDQISSGAVRPFVPPPCARCGAQLRDANGNPRWEIVGRLTFVCLGFCTRL